MQNTTVELVREELEIIRLRRSRAKEREEAEARRVEWEQRINAWAHIDDNERKLLATPVADIATWSNDQLIHLISVMRRRIYKSAMLSHETDGDSWDDWVPEWFEHA